VLLDLPVHPSPPATMHRFDSTLAADFLKSALSSKQWVIEEIQWG